MNQFLSPITHRTGSLVDQPPYVLLRGDWIAASACLDADFDERGGLDAPSAIPAGSVRASDYPRLTIGIDYVERDACAISPRASGARA